MARRPLGRIRCNSALKGDATSGSRQSHWIRRAGTIWLAVEQERSFGLAPRAKIAKTLGLAVPSSILVRAEEVIE